MLKNMATRALITLAVVAALMGTSLFAQGVARQDYSGLDKYPVGGRGEDLDKPGDVIVVYHCKPDCNTSERYNYACHPRPEGYEHENHSQGSCYPSAAAGNQGEHDEAE